MVFKRQWMVRTDFGRKRIAFKSLDCNHDGRRMRLKPAFNEVDTGKTFLFLGMFYIFLDYILFDYSIYRSPPAMLAFVSTFALGIAFLIVPCYARSVGMSKERLRKLSLGVIPLSEIPVIFLMFFDLKYYRFIYWILAPYAPMILAAVIPVLLIFIAEKKLKIAKGHRPRLLFFLAIILASFLTFYAVSQILHRMGWAGTDEMAQDLYAGDFFIRESTPMWSGSSRCLPSSTSSKQA